MEAKETDLAQEWIVRARPVQDSDDGSDSNTYRPVLHHIQTYAARRSLGIAVS